MNNFVKCPSCENKYVPSGDVYEFWDVGTGFYFQCPKCEYIMDINVYKAVMWECEDPNMPQEDIKDWIESGEMSAVMLENEVDLT